MLCISNMATMDEPNTHYNMFFSMVTAQEVDNFLSSHTTIQLYNFALSSIERYKKGVKNSIETHSRQYSELAIRRHEELKRAPKYVQDTSRENDRLKEENKKFKEKLEKQTINYSHISISHEKCMETLYGEKEKLKQELEYAMGEGEKLFQENQELKKELETLKQLELDRILDASMCEIFTTEQQFLRESMIL